MASETSVCLFNVSLFSTTFRTSNYSGMHQHRFQNNPGQGAICPNGSAKPRRMAPRRPRAWNLRALQSKSCLCLIAVVVMSYCLYGYMDVYKEFFYQFLEVPQGA